jgi:hypothetical protein
VLATALPGNKVLWDAVRCGINVNFDFKSLFFGIFCGFFAAREGELNAEIVLSMMRDAMLHPHSFLRL